MNEKLFSEILMNEQRNSVNKVSKMNKYFNYYRGDHGILHKERAGENSPDHRLTFNFIELSVDTNHSYLFSKPQSYDYRERQSSWLQKLFNKNKAENVTRDFLDDLKVVYFDNNEESITSKHGKVSGIAGESVELHYIDKQGNIRFTETDPREWVFFSFKDEDYAVRSYQKETYIESKEGSYEKQVKNFARVYTAGRIQVWEQTEKGFKKIEDKEHFYGEIPVIRFYNRDKIENKDTISDLKNIICLVDAYNFASSSILNTLSYNGDPYMILKNFSFTEEQIEFFKETRIIELIGDDTDVSFLQWDHEIGAYEQFLDRLERLIFILSFTPDLFAKEGLQSDSGKSLEMKFISADLKADQKERTFINSFRKRLRLIAKQLELKTSKEYFTAGAFRNIDIRFNRTIPRNTKELVEMVNALQGTVSDDTRLQLLPFIDNAQEELEKIKSENGLSTSELFGDEDNDRI